MKLNYPSKLGVIYLTILPNAEQNMYTFSIKTATLTDQRSVMRPYEHYLRQLGQLPPLVISSTAGCILTLVIKSLIQVITCKLTTFGSNF